MNGNKWRINYLKENKIESCFNENCCCCCFCFCCYSSLRAEEAGTFHQFETNFPSRRTSEPNRNKLELNISIHHHFCRCMMRESFVYGLFLCWIWTWRGIETYYFDKFRFNGNVWHFWMVFKPIDSDLF